MCIRDRLEDGAFLLKVKIGSDPEKNRDPEAMLAWDIGRLRTVHTAAAGFTTPYTECGRPVYYLDANGRYPDKMCIRDRIERAPW